jgi:hypothetical protein
MSRARLSSRNMMTCPNRVAVTCRLSLRQQRRSADEVLLDRPRRQQFWYTLGHKPPRAKSSPSGGSLGS